MAGSGSRRWLEDAEQFGLHPRRTLADFVQENRAAIGLFKRPGMVRRSACKRPFLVPEQFGFQEFLRDGGAVDGEERTALAVARIVNGAGKQLLAGSRFPQDQHGDIPNRGLLRLPTAKRMALLLPMIWLKPAISCGLRAARC